jgi:hypothetical protein
MQFVVISKFQCVCGGGGDLGDHQSSGCRGRGGCEKWKFAGSGGGGRSSGTPSDPKQRWVGEFRSPNEMGLGEAVSSAAAESGPRRKITFGEILRSATDLRSRRQCSVAVGREEWLSRQLFRSRVRWAEGLWNWVN